jgi:thioredoxin family protein
MSDAIHHGRRRFIGTANQLIRQPRPIAARQLEIEFLDPGVEVFAFTFG